jgi:penicillin-binding protein 2
MLENPIKYKIKKKYRDDIGPEEIFLDSQRLKESPDGEKEKIEKPIKEKVLKLLLGMITIALGLMLFKSFQLQIIKGNYWQSLADENRIRSYPIRPLRGIIYDKNKIPLATNVPKLDLVIVPADLGKNENFSRIIDRLSSALRRPREEIEKKIKDNSSLSYPIIIEENIEREKALLMESDFNDVPEISIEKNSFRQYENGPIFSHLLGYLGKANEEEVSEKKYLFDDYIGRTGLEKIYDEQLRGKSGEQLTEVDSSGKLQKVLAIKDPEMGNDLILSIDAELQEKIYDSLKLKLGTLSTSRAAAVAVNPQNGKILALVSLPGFDNNQFIRGLSVEEFDNIFNNKNEPLFNRAVSGLYPPGSTIKPILASAALTEGVIDVNKQINCLGYLNLFDKFSSSIIWTHNDWKAHGPTNIIKAIAESCDVFFYTIGGGYGDIEGLGIDRIKKYLKLFGLGEISGIDLIGEKPGFIPDAQWKEEAKKEKWYIGDTYNASIGQGDILASPLQIAMATTIVANNGTLFRPQLVEEKKPEIVRKDIIEKGILEIVRRGMREAVVSGSSRFLSDLSVEVAGKTGTAETAKNKAPHSWFTVFAPYENPEIVITILIENGGEGSSTAVPIAKEVLSWYFR